MGYAQSGLQSGAKMLTPQFLNVGATEAIPLQAITPVGSDTSDNVYIHILNAAGISVAGYAWIDWAGEESDQEAWVDEDTFEIIEGVTFEPGQGLWIYGSSSEQGIQTAGKVGSSDITFILRNGAVGVGNPFPVSVDLQDILPGGSDTSDNVYIHILNAAGISVAGYAWIDWAGEESDQEAWVDEDTFEIVEGVSFEPGQGLWVYGSSSEQSITFPAPEL